MRHGDEGGGSGGGICSRGVAARAAWLLRGLLGQRRGGLREAQGCSWRGVGEAGCLVESVCMVMVRMIVRLWVERWFSGLGGGEEEMCTGVTADSRLHGQWERRRGGEGAVRR